jgi:hypothetical protein
MPFLLPGEKEWHPRVFGFCERVSGKCNRKLSGGGSAQSGTLFCDVFGNVADFAGRLTRRGSQFEVD